MAHSSRQRGGDDIAVRLHAVMDTAVDGVIIIDTRGVIQMFNRACEGLFGLSQSEAVGRNVSDLMPRPYREEHDDYIANYLKSGEAKIIGIGRELSGQRSDGSVFPMELSVAQAGDGDDRVFVGIVRDISERRNAERRLMELQADLARVSRLSAMGELSGALAHEISQPLTAIVNYAKACRRLIERDADGAVEKTFAALDEVAEQAHRAGEIIRRLRRFIEKGELDKRPEDINALVRESASFGVAGARGQAILVHDDLADDLPLVPVDKVQIQQVVVNLVRNAADAMGQSQRQELTLRTRLTDDDSIEISIADTGPGLTEEVAERVFDAFVSTKSDGMGLGLSICRSIVEAHHGKISAHGGPGGGTDFRFTLPVVEPEDGADYDD